MIRNGQLAEPVRDVAVSGLTLETLANVLGVSRDFELDMPGHCGKNGQYIPTNGGGPYVKVKEVRGGRSRMSRPREDLLNLAHAACDAARRAGADFADACVEQGRSMSVSVEQNALKPRVTPRTWASLSVRAFAAGSTGWASASGLGLRTARAVGRKAAELARRGRTGSRLHRSGRAVRLPGRARPLRPEPGRSPRGGGGRVDHRQRRRSPHGSRRRFGNRDGARGLLGLGLRE